MKRNYIVVPLPALLLLLAIQLVAPATALSTCPVPPPEEHARTRVGELPHPTASIAPEGWPQVEESLSPTGSGAAPPDPAEPPTAVPAAPTPEDEAKSLLLLLRSAAASEPPVLPKLEFEQASSLLARAPETAAVFLAALEGADRRLRAFLGHLIHGVADARLRNRMLAEYRRTDPTAGILAEILADRGRIIAALRDPSEPQLRKDLIYRIGEPLLADPEILRELLILAESSPDEGVRSRAIGRLARVETAEVRTMLLRVLENSASPPSDRAAVAQAFAFRPCDEVVPVFTRILETGAEAPLLRLSVIGLKKAGNDLRAIDALLQLLLDPAADELARKHASTALSSLALRMGEPDRSELNARIRDALGSLSQDEAEARVLVHAMGEFSRSQPPMFDAKVTSIVEASRTPGFRELAAANPDLKRLLEE